MQVAITIAPGPFKFKDQDDFADFIQSVINDSVHPDIKPFITVTPGG